MPQGRAAAVTAWQQPLPRQPCGSTRARVTDTRPSHGHRMCHQCHGWAGLSFLTLAPKTLGVECWAGAGHAADSSQPCSLETGASQPLSLAAAHLAVCTSCPEILREGRCLLSARGEGWKTGRFGKGRVLCGADTGRTMLDKVAAVPREPQDESLPAVASPDGPSGLVCIGKLLQPQQVLLQASCCASAGSPHPDTEQLLTTSGTPACPTAASKSELLPPKLVQGDPMPPCTQTASFLPLFLPSLFFSTVCFLAGTLPLACSSFLAQGV